ncbi:hypothetical protein XENTR_v10005167 [Xenopus tropicalis]|nr:hypothetical protein XENTR_v10005167 [Xenopus tropicalis]
MAAFQPIICQSNRVACMSVRRALLSKVRTGDFPARHQPEEEKGGGKPSHCLQIKLKKLWMLFQEHKQLRGMPGVCESADSTSDSAL